MGCLGFVVSEYLDYGPFIAVGPINTFYSFGISIFSGKVMVLRKALLNING